MYAKVFRIQDDLAFFHWLVIIILLIYKQLKMSEFWSIRFLYDTHTTQKTYTI